MSGLRLLVVATAVGCGLVGGVFFAFSGFVVPALRRLPAARAVQTFQAINVTAVRPPLMIALFGTAAACSVLLVTAFVLRRPVVSPLLVAAAASYLLGVVVVTGTVNVPLNNALAGVDPDGPAAAAGWEAFVGPWVRANHVRALAGATAAALLTWAATHLDD